MAIAFYYGGGGVQEMSKPTSILKSIYIISTFLLALEIVKIPSNSASEFDFVSKSNL